MSEISTKPFASTTNLALINEWPSIRSIIATNASTIATKQKLDVEAFENLMPLISAEQFDDAVRGPLHPFINKLLSTYALIAKVKLKLIISQDENLGPHIRNQEVDLPDSINIKETNQAALDKMRYNLDELAKEQHQHWQEQIEGWGQQLVMQLTMNDISLSEMEINSLSQLETRSELEAQFTDLHLDLPKLKNDRLYFADYFRLKVILAIRSSLSRQHKAHELADIQKLLKIVKNDFKQISQQEREIITKQHQEIDQITPH